MQIVLHLPFLNRFGLKYEETDNLFNLVNRVLLLSRPVSFSGTLLKLRIQRIRLEPLYRSKMPLKISTENAHLCDDIVINLHTALYSYFLGITLYLYIYWCLQKKNNPIHSK